ncbi:MAG: site-2 protease family protein [Candidatus Pacebacteria bacterium]|nr:site-2 protease family protein [Candidatus Paceibacterota bacterium]
METMTMIFYIIILIFSVVIHELAHGYAADALGDPTPRMQKRLTLNPLAHIDWFGSVILPFLLVVLKAGFILGWAKPVMFNPYNLRNRKWGPALIALAGPLSNIGIALFFGVLIRVAPMIGITAAPFFTLASALVFINIMLAIFNMIPVPPLDGHHILFALIPEKYNHIKNTLMRYSLFFCTPCRFLCMAICNSCCFLAFYTVYRNVFYILVPIMRIMSFIKDTTVLLVSFITDIDRCIWVEVG